MRMTSVWPSEASASSAAITRLARMAAPEAKPATPMAPHAKMAAATTTCSRGTRDWIMPIRASSRPGVTVADGGAVSGSKPASLMSVPPIGQVTASRR